MTQVQTATKGVKFGTKGVSGNPRGRVPMIERTKEQRIMADVRLACKEISRDAVDVLNEVMKDKTAPHQARLTAANSILDRAWGRPQQNTEITINQFEKMGENELLAFIAGAFAAAAEVIPDTGGRGAIDVTEASTEESV